MLAPSCELALEGRPRRVDKRNVAPVRLLRRLAHETDTRSAVGDGNAACVSSANWPGASAGRVHLRWQPQGTTPIRPDSLGDRLAEARGHSNVTFQDLRHHVATTMFDAGVPYRTVADLLGNSEVTLRLHYDGRTDTGKRAAVKALRRTPG